MGAFSNASNDESLIGRHDRSTWPVKGSINYYFNAWNVISHDEGGCFLAFEPRFDLSSTVHTRVVRRRFVRVRVQLYTLYTLAYTRRFSLKGSSVWTSFVTTPIVCVIHAECAERRNYRTDRVISRHVTLGYVCVALIRLKFTEILSPLTFVRIAISFEALSLSFISSDLEKVRLSRDNSILPRAANH